MSLEGNLIDLSVVFKVIAYWWDVMFYNKSYLETLNPSLSITEHWLVYFSAANTLLFHGHNTYKQI